MYRSIGALFVFLFLFVSPAFSQPDSSSCDSLSVRISDLQQENQRLVEKTVDLEKKHQRSLRAVNREQKNVPYLFAAYIILWAILFAFMFYQSMRIKELNKEANLLREILKEPDKSI